MTHSHYISYVGNMAGDIPSVEVEAVALLSSRTTIGVIGKASEFVQIYAQHAGFAAFVLPGP